MKTKEVLEVKNLRLWNGNLSIYWLIGTTVGLWFIFIYTPQHINSKGLQAYGTNFWIHIAFACFTYIACMWNVFHTPSHGPWYTRAHILIGRAAVIASILGFAFGLWMSWGPGTNTPIGLAIGLTSGGIAQVLSTIIGLIAIKLYQQENAKLVPDDIRKSWYLRIHIASMLALFLPACGTPAVMRLFAGIGLDKKIGLPVGVAIFSAFIPLTIRSLNNKTWY